MKNILMVFLGLLLVCNMLFSESVIDATTLISVVKIENESYYTPYPAEPGQYVDIWLRVKQSGTVATAENVVCRLEPKFPFSLDSGESAERSLGTLQRGQIVLLKYRLKVSSDAVEGNNELEFKCKAGDEKEWSTTTFYIYVQTHDPILSITDVNAEPEAILPGEKGKITITLTNYADTSLKDISIVLDLSSSALPFAPYNDVTEKRIRQLASGQSENVQFEIEASPSAEVDVYKIPVALSYSDNLGKDFTKKTYISLAVDADPKLFFGLESTTVNKQNSKGKVTISIANKGLSDIKFTTIKLLNSSDYLILSTNEKYVGNLDPDDSTSTDFEIYTNSSKKAVELPFEITYMDEFGRSHTKKEVITILLYSQEETLALGIEKKSENEIFYYIVGGIILLIIIWQGLKLLKKSK